MSWTICKKCDVALAWGDLYCHNCGAENPQGKEDLEKARKESEVYKGQQEECDHIQQADESRGENAVLFSGKCDKCGKIIERF